MFRNGLQPAHIVLLVVVILLVFGASRLPDIARSLGKSAKVLKEEIKDLRDEPTPPSAGQVPPVSDAAQPPYAQGTGQAPPTPGVPYTPSDPAQPGASTPTEWPPGSSR